MALSIEQDLQNQLNNVLKGIEKKSQEIAIQTAKAVLMRNKSAYTKKLRSIIDVCFYRRYAESQYYERTYQFRDKARCKPIIEGNNLFLEIWFDTDNIYVFEPTQKGNYYSYAYSWGERKGDFIGEEAVEELYSGFLRKTDILEEFMEWFEDDFQSKFETLFNQRIDSLNN